MPLRQFPKQTFKCGHRHESWRQARDTRKSLCYDCDPRFKKKEPDQTGC